MAKPQCPGSHSPTASPVICLFLGPGTFFRIYVFQCLRLWHLASHFYLTVFPLKELFPERAGDGNTASLVHSLLLVQRANCIPASPLSLICHLPACIHSFLHLRSQTIRCCARGPRVCSKSWGQWCHRIYKDRAYLGGNFVTGETLGSPRTCAKNRGHPQMLFEDSDPVSLTENQF